MEKKSKILIIDDNSMIRALFVSDFEDNFEIETASSGAEGVAAATRTHPDVILLDINMPDLSGVQVTRQLALQAETRDIPIIVITASEFNSTTQKQLRCYSNCKGFLSKLAPIGEIQGVISKVLSGRK